MRSDEKFASRRHAIDTMVQNLPFKPSGPALPSTPLIPARPGKPGSPGSPLRPADELNVKIKPI
jgi:hypothetical protein